jgi:hypothetical protein
MVVLTLIISLLGNAVASESRAVASYPSCDGVSGSGTAADPWRLDTNEDFICFRYDLIGAPNVSGELWYVEQMADLTWEFDRSVPIPAGFESLRYDGRGHSVTIKNMSAITGLFGTTSNSRISNVIVHAANSSIDFGMGWLAGVDQGSTFVNVASTGPIERDGGGIVGAASSTTVEQAYSTGSIGQYAGGILGFGSQSSTVSTSFSQGTIGQDGGGIVGMSSGAVQVMSSYSTGSISDGGGGIFGAQSQGASVVNSYSLGALGAQSNGLFGNSSLVTGASGYAAEGNAWSDVAAQEALSGYGITWGTCATNRPWFLLAFYPQGICDAPLETRVIYDGSSPPPTAITAPPNDQFSLENKGTSGPFSWVSLVNGTGSVKVGSVLCSQVTTCKVPDMAQDESSSQMVFTIVSPGTVTMHRYVSGVSGSTVVGTFTVGAVEQPQGPPSSPDSSAGTTSAAPPSGNSSTLTLPSTSGGTKSVLSLKRGKTLRRPALLKFAQLKMSKGDSFGLAVQKSSRRRCTPTGSALKALQVGQCRLKLSITTPSGKTRSRTIAVTIVD